MNLDINSIIVYSACIFFLFIFGRIFIVPIKTVLKLIINSLLGGLIILVINFVGKIWGFHIGLNIITAIFVGLLGVPGAIVITLIKLLLK